MARVLELDSLREHQTPGRAQPVRCVSDTSGTPDSAIRREIKALIRLNIQRNSISFPAAPSSPVIFDPFFFASQSERDKWIVNNRECEIDGEETDELQRGV